MWSLDCFGGFFVVVLLGFFSQNVLGGKHAQKTATENLVPKTRSLTKIFTAGKSEQKGKK